VKARLLELLICPWCRQSFELEAFDPPTSLGAGPPDATDNVNEGVLRCQCPRVFPIVNGIPRILADAFSQFPDFVQRYGSRVPDIPKIAATERPPEDAIAKTRDSFGYQWTTFKEMVIDFRENFLNYIHPVEPSFFPGKLGLDLGCGFGRHIYNAAHFGAEMVGLDISDAIESTRENTRDLPNVHLVQADIYHIPFRPGTFDFGYSIGVLHHLPDPEAGFTALVRVVKPRGSVFVWVYSKKRALMNRMLEGVRSVTKRLPKGVQQGISYAAAVVDYGGFIVPYKTASALPGIGNVVKKLPLPRLKLYSAYPFQVVYADWFDRLAPPIRFYYDGDDMKGWLTRAQLTSHAISPTGLYGWRAYGERG
jgi:SAM-dependent methyltransferase